MQAVASLHLLWLMALVPPAVVLARWRPGPVTGRLGVFIALLGLLVTACAIAKGFTQWRYSPSNPGYTGFAVRRAAYTLATRTDVPAIQLVFAGMLMTVAARRRPGPVREANPNTPTAAGMIAAKIDSEADRPPSTGA